MSTLFPNVIDFGAVGNGVTDDTAAILATVAATPGPIIFPPGHRYKYGGGIAFAEGFSLYDKKPLSGPVSDTLVVSRDNSASGGSTSQQTGALIVRSSVAAGVKNHEFGAFVILDNRSAEAGTEPVAFYSQAHNLDGGNRPLWAGVFEVGNITADGRMATQDAVLCGLEVDVSNRFAISGQKKIGVEVIAFGGGEVDEGYSLYAGNQTRGNGTYQSGNFRTGFFIAGNALHATLGVGMAIYSEQGTALQVVGASSYAGINLAANGPSLAGIVVGANYSHPISIEPNKKIRLNGLSNGQGVSYDSAKAATIIESAAIGVQSATVRSSVLNGSGPAMPARAELLIDFYVNGTRFLLPLYKA